MITSSVREIREVPGARFASAVEHAGDVTAQPEEKLKLPDGTFAFLTALPRAKDPADQAELKYLLGARFELNERTMQYVTARLAEWRSDAEAAHEEAKRAVREQGAVLEGLKVKLAEDTQDWIRADNARRLAQTAAWNADQDLKGLSRFASRKQIVEAEKRVSEANKKMQAAETKAAELGQFLNSLKIVTIPAEQEKLAALMEKELELAAQLEGRDPRMVTSGILQR